jgi:hypothetical protein
MIAGNWLQILPPAAIPVPGLTARGRTRATTGICFAPSVLPGRGKKMPRTASRRSVDRKLPALVGWQSIHPLSPGVSTKGSSNVSNSPARSVNRASARWNTHGAPVPVAGYRRWVLSSSGT